MSLERIATLAEQAGFQIRIVQINSGWGTANKELVIWNDRFSLRFTVDHIKNGRETTTENILKTIVGLRPHGYTCVKWGNGGYHGIQFWLVGKGTKMVVEYGTPTNIKRYTRDETGGYGEPRVAQLPKYDVTLVVQCGAALAATPPVKRVAPKGIVLGDPHEFVQAEPLIRAQNGQYSHNIGLCHHVRFLGFRAMMENRDIVNCTDPTKASVWAYFECENYEENRGPKLLTFHIITNGEGWYLVTKSGEKMKAVPDIKKGQLDLSGMSNIDLDLLSMIIRRETEG